MYNQGSHLKEQVTRCPECDTLLGLSKKQWTGYEPVDCIICHCRFIKIKGTDDWLVLRRKHKL